MKRIAPPSTLPSSLFHSSILLSQAGLCEGVVGVIESGEEGPRRRRLLPVMLLLLLLLLLTVGSQWRTRGEHSHSYTGGTLETSSDPNSLQHLHRLHEVCTV